MKLIVETLDRKLEVITETKHTGEKDFYIEGIFMQADEKNRNGRIYPRSIMESAVDKYVNEQVKSDRACGELGHPDSPTINLDRVSHKIMNLEWNGSNVNGKAKILNTPMGQIAKGLLEGGVKLGVSSRGMGSIESKNGVNYVKDDFQLATVDIVQDPSAPKAFVNGIMEGVEYFYDSKTNSYVAQKAEEVRDQLKKLSTRQIAEAQERVFQNFLMEIKKAR